MHKFISASVLAALAQATPEQMQADLIALVQNSSMRAFTGQIAQSVTQLDEYGCWCYSVLESSGFIFEKWCQKCEISRINCLKTCEIIKPRF